MISSVGISTKVFDLEGHAELFDVIDQSSDLTNYSRRMTRTATLDTGAFIDDRGFYDGDRTIDVTVPDNKTLFDRLTYIIKNYGSLLIMLPDGAFNGNMQSLTLANGRIRVTLLLESAA